MFGNVVVSVQHMPHGAILSSLQDRILRLICTTRNVSYTTLIQETHRDRTTILQSVESLIKHGLIEKQKINPEYEKSKLIFKATNTGKQIAYSYLGVSLEDIMKLEEDKQITEYLEFIKDITDPLQRKALLQPLSDLLTSPRAWRVEADEKTRSTRRDILKNGFKESLLELLQIKNYEVKNLFNTRSTKWLAKLFTTKEINEIKEFVRHVRDKADVTIEMFSV